MKARFWWFNLNLALALCCAAAGCQTNSGKKEASTIRFHRVVDVNSGGRIARATVFRETPFEIHVEEDPFLSERDVEEAAVVNDMESFFIKIKFNRHGTLLLDTITTEGKDRRIAIFSEFGASRWLAAPIYQQRLTNGVLYFTPDATRAEAERIVRGLNNVARKLKTKNF